MRCEYGQMIVIAFSVSRFDAAAACIHDTIAIRLIFCAIEVVRWI